jgi:hypothetical protein
MQGAGCATGERICDQSSLIGPPAVNGSFANSGVSRNIFNRQIQKTVLP